MNKPIKAYKDETIHELNSIISRCEKAQLKCKEGTSQYTLLKNRIKALCISKSLMDEQPLIYVKKELEEALAPVLSIIHKCEKAQSKYKEGTTQYNRYINMINVMQLSKMIIEKELAQF